MNLFNLNQLLTALSSNIVTLGVRASTKEFYGDTVLSAAFPQLREFSGLCLGAPSL